ncbi:MAG: hypothetical protein CMJ83_01210 [Planctomycetes bacterium]|nr:hypothetical protein [Planctomycetota bacterium]
MLVPDLARPGDDRVGPLPNGGGRRLARERHQGPGDHELGEIALDLGAASRERRQLLLDLRALRTNVAHTFEHGFDTRLLQQERLLHGLRIRRSRMLFGLPLEDRDRAARAAHTVEVFQDLARAAGIRDRSGESLALELLSMVIDLHVQLERVIEEVAAHGLTRELAAASIEFRRLAPRLGQSSLQVFDLGSA